MSATLNCFVDAGINEPHTYPVRYSWEDEFGQVQKWATVITGRTPEEALENFRAENPTLLSAEIIV